MMFAEPVQPHTPSVEKVTNERENTLANSELYSTLFRTLKGTKTFEYGELRDWKILPLSVFKLFSLRHLVHTESKEHKKTVDGHGDRNAPKLSHF